jgi:hypothetical protein
MTTATRTPASSADKGIHSRAMLVRLSVSCWDGRRFDKDVTRDVNERHAATQEAGRYNKHLLGGKSNAPMHKEAVSKGGAARQAFYSNTLPWADEGWRLLPTKNYERFTDALRAARSEFEETVEAFIADYPRLKAQARQLLNGMYREEDYPTAAALRGKFKFSIEFAPVPSAGDFRLDLSADQLIDIESNAAARVERATKDAMNEAWTRLHDVVEKVHERLTGRVEEGKKKGSLKIFHDSLVENVAKLTDILPRFNVTNDPGLEAMRKRVEDELADLDPKALREQPKERAKAAKSATDILSAMEGLYGSGVK